MKTIPFTLSLYIMRQFLFYLGITLSTFSLLIIILDALELFRRSATHDVPFFAIMQMAVLKFPLMGQKVLPFVMLITGVMCYTQLTRHNELAVCRAAGVSVWQFMMPSAVIAFIFGIFMTTTFNPLACAMAAKFEQQEAKYLSGRNSLLEVSATGLWLRQRSETTFPTIRTPYPAETIIHALGAEQTAENITLSNLNIFVFEENNVFEKRIDAKSAKLLNGFWHLQHAVLTTNNGLTYKHDEYFLETDLTVNDIQNSFASPETISFWDMPGFIATLKKSGFTALKHQMHWYSILVSPFLYAAMIFIAALFSLSPARSGKTGLLITGSILSGFLIYFAINVVSSLGIAGNIPIPLAAWAPVITSLLAGIGLLLHLEDG